MRTDIVRKDLPPCTYDAQEEKLSLSLQTSMSGDITVIHCRGRIVFREEAAALSHAVTAVLQPGKHVILDLHGVTAIDSGGMGELVALHMWAQGCGSTLKLSGLNSRLLYLLELTNLTSIFEIFATEEAALSACMVA